MFQSNASRQFAFVGGGGGENMNLQSVTKLTGPLSFCADYFFAEQLKKKPNNQTVSVGVIWGSSLDAFPLWAMLEVNNGSEEMITSEL